MVRGASRAASASTHFPPAAEVPGLAGDATQRNDHDDDDAFDDTDDDDDDDDVDNDG